MTPKKQTFLHGTMLLALSTAIVKVIGAFYSIPLKQIIGDESFGYYSTAYEIYTLLLMISTAGLPVAMSRMISQASSLGHYRQLRKIYTVSRTIFLSLGIAGTLLMTVFCRQLAIFQEQPDAWAAIGTLGPCCLFICLMSTYRGFFQGQSNMKPTSVSQVLEAICKLIVGLGAAILLVRFSGEKAYPAAGAIFGVTLSCVISSVYLKACFQKAYQDIPETAEPVSSGKEIAKSLLAIAIPITIGSAGLQLLTVLETKIYMGQLLQTMTQNQADIQKGIYNFTQKIFNMPCAFITPITISVIPAITAQITTGDHKAAKITEESAARITGLISAPCAIGLFLLAEPIVSLLGGYTGERLTLATNLMSILGLCILFNGVVLFTNAVMQAHGHVTLPVVNMFIGGVLKLVAVFFLTGNVQIGILGTPIGSLLCYVAITVLNLFSIRRVFPNPPAIAKNLLKSLLAALVMGAFAWGSWQGLVYLTGGNLSRVIACAVPIAVAAPVYILAAVKFRAITYEDCLLLPKGEKVAKLLKLSK